MAGKSALIIANLLTESREFGDFVELLKTEQDTLSKGDIDRLVALAQLKSEKVVALAQIEEQRNKALAAAGFTPDYPGMEAWLKQTASENPQAAALWNEVLKKARQAQQLNLANGSMIQQKLSHNQQALAILQAATNQVSTYGPDGQTHGGSHGRKLGKV